MRLALRRPLAPHKTTRATPLGEGRLTKATLWMKRERLPVSSTVLTGLWRFATFQTFTTPR